MGANRNLRAPMPLVALAIALAASACRSFPGVDELGSRRVYRQLDAGAMTTGSLSLFSENVFYRYGLAREVGSNRLVAIRELHRIARESGDSDALFALAEASYLLQSRKHREAAMLSAAVYAHDFLFGDGGVRLDARFDPRIEAARKLYNRALHQALIDPRTLSISIEPALRDLLIGSILIDVDRSRFDWRDGAFDTFLVADEFSPHGYGVHNRQSGFGVPLIATSKLWENARFEVDDVQVPRSLQTAASTVLSIAPITHGAGSSGSTTIESGGEVRTATLSLHSFRNAKTQMAGCEVPLEFDPTVAVARTFDRSSMWDVTMLTLLFEDPDSDPHVLAFAEPYVPGKIPVVFVHGTGSSISTWAEIFNSLLSDADFRTRYQSWFYTYDSGSPVGISAAGLRQHLKAALDSIDPDRQDAALQRIVLVGHSQGGLLVRLLVSSSTPEFYASFLDVPIESLEFPDDTRDEFMSWFDFVPVPEVERAVFISTPHRGSHRITDFISELFNRFTRMPRRLTARFQRLVETNTSLLRGSSPPELQSSVADQAPDDEFIRGLAHTILAPDVRLHSIIGVEDPDRPREYWTDGIVDYTSAHLDGVDSEIVLEGEHSILQNPIVALELRRILREHVGLPAARLPDSLRVDFELGTADAAPAAPFESAAERELSP